MRDDNRWLENLGKSSEQLTKEKTKGMSISSRENCVCEDLLVIISLMKLKGRRRDCVLK